MKDFNDLCDVEIDIYECTISWYAHTQVYTLMAVLTADKVKRFIGTVKLYIKLIWIEWNFFTGGASLVQIQFNISDWCMWYNTLYNIIYIYEYWRIVQKCIVVFPWKRTSCRGPATSSYKRKNAHKSKVIHEPSSQPSW